MLTSTHSTLKYAYALISTAQAFAVACLVLGLRVAVLLHATRQASVVEKGGELR